ncbi:hypothetical protein I545_5894 [Mycobacterium kansasii 662]|uniref:Uncharacterized protein n=1 Tax=Mycobacterium kansasii 662 TaxID=1299326 RepID=X7YT76_MYCKA|nr:hypothetical protein I545_5894 [Mycobacterium kansasii 662]
MLKDYLDVVGRSRHQPNCDQMHQVLEWASGDCPVSACWQTVCVIER